MTAANIHKSWVGVDASELFSVATGCPVHMLNDADAAGTAEMRFGAGQDRKDVVLLVTIGTGLGTVLYLLAGILGGGAIILGIRHCRPETDDNSALPPTPPPYMESNENGRPTPPQPPSPPPIRPPE